MLRGLVDTRERRLLFATGTLAFLAIGALQAMYGPAFPALLARYRLGIGEVGAVVSAHFLGSFAAIAASGLLLKRFGYRRLLVSGAAAMTVGATGVAFAPAWLVTLAAALVGGVGFGLVDVAMNLLFARGFEERATAALNLLNACFGLGAVAGPVLIGLLAPRMAPAFLVAALLTAVAGALATVAPMPRPLTVPATTLRARRAPLVGFVVLYFVYVSCEVGVASWEPSYLGPLLGSASAAFITGIYWGALTLGRLVAAVVGDRLEPSNLVLGGVGLATVAVGLAGIPALAPAAFALVGFGFAPVFPTTLAWIQRVFPQRAEQVAPVAIAAANLGPVATAPAIGWAVARAGTGRIPTVLGVLILALAATVLVLWRATRTRVEGSPG